MACVRQFPLSTMWVFKHRLLVLVAVSFPQSHRASPVCCLVIEVIFLKVLIFKAHLSNKKLTVCIYFVLNHSYCIEIDPVFIIHDVSIILVC